ncbi:MAG: EAL domain-containing protein [Lachnospiraceae bacterium]|nr:EAL domain-containing protein [Lachnospiraceae bacterium]
MAKNKKIHTLRTSIIRILISIAILQLGIITGAIILFGTTDQLDANAEQSLKDTVETQGEKLEEKMGSWSEMSQILARINEISETYCLDNGTDIETLMEDPKQETKLLQNYTATIMKLLRVSGTTGSFVILDGKKNSTEKYSIYFRDLDPNVYSKDDRDILVEAGPGEYLVNSGYALDFSWKTCLSLNENSDFYYKPYEAALAYGDTIDANDLGYWSTTFRMNPGDHEIITYSVPLITEEGKVYGVVGIELGLDYLEEMVDSKEIIVDDNAGMMLVTSDREENQERYKAWMVSGAQYQSFLPTGTEFSIQDSKNGLFRATLFDKDRHTASKYTLHVYNSNTPFENEEWSMVGIAHDWALKKTSTNLIFRLLISSVIVLCISIIFALVFAFRTTEPIYKLMRGISDMNDANAHLPRTNLREFNELGAEIEKRNKAIWESTNKMANIIKMTNLPLGVFEYDEFTEHNFCTEKVLEFFEIDRENTSWRNNYFDREEMKAGIEKIRNRLTLETEEKEVYYYETSNHDKKWVRIKMVGTPKHYLCIIMDMTDEMNEKQKIKHDRDYDILTDLYNRRAFRREVANILTKKPDTTGVMSIWDLDNLKYMNDTYGHDMGDRYIALLAQVFRSAERPNMLMCRMSGDEFLIFVYDENIAKSCEIMRDIHRAFLNEKIQLPDGSKISVSASAGMAIYPHDGANYKDLLKYADFAMYEVKNNEKGAIRSFDRDHYLKDYILVQGVGELTRILNEESIRYVFQPIVDVRTKQVYAYEALMRPQSELLKGPQEFIRLAESQSKLRQIEVMTWMHAIRTYGEQISDNACSKDIKLFINSTPGQCLQEEEFTYLEENYGELLSHIVMEVTEIAKTDVKQEQEKYAWCKKHHIMVALDDYGSGYNNNDVLVSSKLDFVKLDMTIIRDIHMLPARQRLVKGMIDYCHEKQILVIAEGIERREELKELIDMGTDYAQGYYFARPQNEITDLNDRIRELFE